MNRQKNSSAQAADFIELLSQDLPWDDIDRALDDKYDDQLVSTVTDLDSSCSPAEEEFNPDDLSLFNAFANSLPSVAAAHLAVSDTATKPNSSSVVCVQGDAADARTDLVPDTETEISEEDFDCPDDISLSSQMEDIMADILESSDGVDCGKKRATDDEHEQQQVYSERGDGSALQSGDSDVGDEQTERTCGVKSSCVADNERCRMKEATSDAGEDLCTVNEKNVSMLQRGEIVCDNSSVTDRDNAVECGGGDTQDEEQSTRFDNSGCEDSSNNVDNDSDDSDMSAASQEWLCDQIRTHLIQQHDEASRMNSLRVPPPPGTQSVARDCISRAIHAFSAELEVMKLDEELTSALLADNPDISRCCKLLDDYNPYEMSPGVLVRYPFFAGTVEVCCRWVGDLADELHTAAHRLRAFMMAMYARNSIHEGFLTALDRRV